MEEKSQFRQYGGGRLKTRRGREIAELGISPSSPLHIQVVVLLVESLFPSLFFSLPLFLRWRFLGLHDAGRGRRGGVRDCKRSLMKKQMKMVVVGEGKGERIGRTGWGICSERGWAGCVCVCVSAYESICARLL